MQKLNGDIVEVTKYLNKMVKECREQTGCMPDIDDYEFTIHSEEFEERFADSCGIHSLDDLLNFYVGLGGLVCETMISKN